MTATGGRPKPRRRRLLRRARKEAAEGVEDAVEDGCGCGCVSEGCLGAIALATLAAMARRRLR